MLVAGQHEWVYSRCFTGTPADLMKQGGFNVDGGRALLILDPDSGLQTGSVYAGDATGVCFAQRQPHTPIREIVYSTR